MKNKIIVKAVLFDESGRVLLMRRSKDDTDRPGDQDFPGGGPDQGEDFRAALSREIREEAGLEVLAQSLQLFYTHTEMFDGVNAMRLLFWAQVKNPQVVLSFEHEAYKWVPAVQVTEEFPHRVYGDAMAYGLANKVFAPVI